LYIEEESSLLSEGVYDIGIIGIMQKMKKAFGVSFS